MPDVAFLTAQELAAIVRASPWWITTVMRNIRGSLERGLLNGSAEPPNRPPSKGSTRPSGPPRGAGRAEDPEVGGVP